MNAYIVYEKSHAYDLTIWHNQWSGEGVERTHVRVYTYTCTDTDADTESTTDSTTEGTAESTTERPTMKAFP